MSKPYTPDSRKSKYDARYLHKVLSGIDQGIPVPSSLSAEHLRPLLESVPDSDRRKPGLAGLADLFLHSRLFSLQSAVSYALAFVVIVAVAYALQYNAPDLVDGSVTVSDAMSAEEQKSFQADMPVSPGGEIAAQPRGSAQSSSYTAPVPEASEQAVPAPADDAVSAGSASGGVGGSGETVLIGEDALFSYLYRVNDRNDPDKADFPITIEVVDLETDLPVDQIDIPDIQSILYPFFAPGVVGLVGAGDDSVISCAYATEHGGEAALTELFHLSQPGRYVQSRIYEGILHTVSTGDAALLEDIHTERLQDSDSSLACIVTAADLESGLSNEIAYLGIDPDKDISLHNRNIYIPYTGVPEDGEAELYMAQIKLDHIDFEMILVP